ncbi:MAG: hypothetical protein HKM07_06190 [Chlamydiae bacterium]|jgi:hypothetical protein|nr:hypothetical protein [Chlamydiota bacterium]
MDTSEISTYEQGVFHLPKGRFVPHLQFDARSFKKDSEYNGVVISLPAGLASDLDWSLQKEIAESVVENKGQILWKLDFSLHDSSFSYTDSMAFQSFTIAIEQFVKTLHANFAANTLGVIIYQGDIDFYHRFTWDASLQNNLEEWLVQMGQEENGLHHYNEFYEKEIGNLLLSRYCTSVFSEYLHRLISYLPDTLPVFCLLDVTEESSFAKVAHLLSKERFPHVHLIIRGSIYPFGELLWDDTCIRSMPIQDNIIVGVCVPSEEICGLSHLSDLEIIIQDLSQKKIPFRMIFESLLNEQWGELEEIVIISSGISVQGKRKLQGFCAAGGFVVSYGKKLGLIQEMSFEDYKKKSE